MFKNIDFNTKKYSILMLIICIAFFVFVIKTFEYLPVTDEEAATNFEKMKNINTQKIEEVKNDSDDETELEDKNISKKTKNKHVHIDFMKSENEDIEPIEEIQAPKGVNYEKINTSVSSDKNNDNNVTELSNEEKCMISIYKANKLYTEGQYTKAVQEYRSILNLTKDQDIVASAYEGIAQVYAANKKYGTALSFAMKAYTISPSSSREMLLARIYYKTGDIDKTTKRVNNILHRSFSEN